MKKTLLVLCACLLAGMAWIVWPLAGAGTEVDAPVHDSALASSNRDPDPPGEEEPRRAVRRQIGAVGRESYLLTGVVLDQSGSPVANAAVRVLHRHTDGINSLDLEYNYLRDELAESKTEADGTFAFSVPAFQSLMLEVRADGYGTRTIPGCYAGGDYVVTVQAGAVIEGLVRRASDFSPLSDATVTLFEPRISERQLMTDSRGFYRFEGLAADSFRLEVLSPDGVPDWASLQPRPGQILRHDVLLESGGVVTGTVTDAATGEPIEDAEVGEGWSFSRTVRTDAGGYYVFSGASETRAPDLYARAAGYGRQGKPGGNLENGKKVLDFQLQSAGAATGRIVDAQGTPLVGIYVAGVASTRDRETQRQETDWQSGRTNDDGQFLIADLRPDVAHTLLVRNPGQGTLVYEFPELPDPDHVIEFGDVVLSPGGTISGRVTDGSGHGIASRGVSIIGTNGDRLRYAPEGDRESASAGGTYVTRRSLTTGENGVFHFTDLSPGEYVVLTRLQSKRIEQKVVIYQPGGLVNGVALVADSGSSIQGTVITGDGTPVSTGTLRVESEMPGGGSQLFRVRGGRFGTSDLQPGTYRVIAIPHAGDDEDPWFVGEVTGVKAGTSGLQIALARAAWIEGKVVDASGVGISGLTVDVDSPRGILRDAPRSIWLTGEDGSFRVRVGEEETVNLSVWAPEEVTGQPNRWLFVERVVAGARDLLIRIQ